MTSGPPGYTALPRSTFLQSGSALHLDQSQTNAAIMPMVKFVYFDAEAKGEVARLLLAAGNIDYEDFRISFADWPKHKADTPFGQMPVLHWDGEELAQSWAINKFIARKVGWAGKTDLEFAQADMVTCHTEDLWTKWPKLCFDQTVLPQGS